MRAAKPSFERGPEGLEVGPCTERRRRQQQLDVGQRDIVARFQEGGHAARHVGRETLAEEIGFRQFAADPVGPHHVVEGRRFLAPVHQDGRGVVLQVPPDAGQVELDVDRQRLQVGRRPDAGELQQLRRVDHPAAEQHLPLGTGHAGLAILRIFDAGGTRALQEDASGQRPGLDRQVRPVQGGPQIGRGGAAAAPLADGHLQAAEALLPGAVVILRPAVAGLLAGLDIGAEQRILVAAELRGDRAVRSPVGAGLALPMFQLAEIGQRIGIRPFGQTILRPPVVIAAVSAHERHGVRGRRPADHLATGTFDAPAVGMRLRFAEIHPVMQPLLQDLAPAERYMDPGIPVPAPGLEQQNARTAILGEAGRERAAGRTGPYDHVIIGRAGHRTLMQRLCGEYSTTVQPILSTEVGGASFSLRNGSSLAIDLYGCRCSVGTQDDDGDHHTRRA